MAEEILIGRLILDGSDIQATLASSKQSIVELENEQKELKKSTDNLSNATQEQAKAFVDNELKLKAARTAYAANQKSVLDFTRAQLGVDAALNATVKTQADAEANTRTLTNARKQLDTTTVEGAKAIAAINAKIDANNKLIKDNSSELEKQKANVGNYPKILGDVGNAFGGVTGNVIGFVQQGKEMTDALGALGTLLTTNARTLIGFGRATEVAAVDTELLTLAQTQQALATQAAIVETGALTAAEGAEAAAAAAATAATTGLTTATGALVTAEGAATTATGALAAAEIGLGGASVVAAAGENVATASTWGLNTALGILLFPITAVIAIILILYNIFKTFKPLTDKVENGIAALSAAFNVVKNAIVALVTGAKSLTEVFSSLGSDMDDAAKSATALADAQRDLEDALQTQEVASARTRVEINKLNVQLKDRTKSEQERVAISNKITALTQADYEKRRNLALEEVRQAKESIRIKAVLSKEEAAILDQSSNKMKSFLESRGGDYDEDLKRLDDARKGALSIEDEASVALEKQLTKRDKLEDDAAAKAQARADKAKAAAEKLHARELKDLQNSIDIFKLKAAASDLSADQQIANAQKVYDMQVELAKKGSEGTDQDKKLLEAKQTLSSDLLKIAQDQIDKEIEAQKALFEAKGVANQKEYEKQLESAEMLAKAQILLLDKQLLTEKDYADEVVKINDAMNAAKLLSQRNYEEADKAQRELALENQKALDAVNFEIRLQDIADKKATEGEIEKMIRDEQYAQELIDLENNLKAKKISNDVYLASLGLANKKYAADTKKNDKTIADQKRAYNNQMLTDGAGALTALFGESKAVAVAAALINTYQGITAGVALGYPAAIPAVAFAAATGFAAVKNILKTDKSSTGVESGASTPQTTTGAASFVNSAQTETVAQVSEKPVEQNTVVSPPVLILEQLSEATDNLAIKITSG
jgi:hypothetical protein